MRWIVIYPVDSAIQRLNNLGQVNCVNITPRESSEEQKLSEIEIHILIICPLTSMNACHNYQKIRGKVHLEHNFSYHRFRYVASCKLLLNRFTGEKRLIGQRATT